MAVQSRSDNVTNKLIRTENSLVRNGVISQDAQRTADLLQYTVMAFNATSLQWVPFTDLTATNGEGVPRGIYMGGDIEAADLVAGDIEDAPILVGNAVVDRDLVVWDEDTLNENSIVNPGTIEARTALYALQQAANIYFEDSILISYFEN